MDQKLNFLDILYIHIIRIQILQYIQIIKWPNTNTPPGFVWRRMIHDVEDLPRPRTPHLGPAAPGTPTGPDGGINTNTWPQVNSSNLQQQDLELSTRPDYVPVCMPSRAMSQQQQQQFKSLPQPTTTVTTVSDQMPRGNSSRVRLGDTRQGTNSNAPSLEDDTASLNSFKTCPSEPNLSVGGMVPRQVSDSYETRILGPGGGGGGGGGGSSGSGGGSSLTSSQSVPSRIILRANSYAADPPPPRSPSGSAGSSSPGGGQLQPPPPPSIGMQEGDGVAVISSRRPRLSPSPSSSAHIRWKEPTKWDDG